MSKEAMTQVIERARTDGAFREQLRSSPASALASYELTAEERAALRSGDRSRLQALGLELSDEELAQVAGGFIDPLDDLQERR